MKYVLYNLCISFLSRIHNTQQFSLSPFLSPVCLSVWRTRTLTWIHTHALSLTLLLILNRYIWMFQYFLRFSFCYFAMFIIVSDSSACSYMHGFRIYSNYGYRYPSVFITMVRDTLVLNNVKSSITNVDCRVRYNISECLEKMQWKTFG